MTWQIYWVRTSKNSPVGERLIVDKLDVWILDQLSEN